MKKFLYLLFLTISISYCQSPEPRAASVLTPINSSKIDKIGGLNFVAPPDEFSGNPMTDVKAVNADWIAVIPYGYTRSNEPSVRYNIDWQWWGERVVGAKTTIELAHKEGIKVMLKPQVYIPGSWPGGLDFESDADWKKWETDYRTFILEFAKIGAEQQVEMFCIGTEFKHSATKHPDFWRGIIKEIRAIYDGKLIYAANWDCYQEIPFWDELDYIGIDAYFPLVDAETPSHEALIKAWQPITESMSVFAKKAQKQIIFTEFGYLSVDNCAYQNWELEKIIDNCKVNQQAQANAIHALLENFSKEDFWAGGFIWKWFPEGQGHEGYPAKDYTPQGKLGEEVLKEWYGGF